MSSITAEQLHRFQAGFAGTVLTADDADYDEFRRIHNGLIDKRPMVIARCSSAADVVAAVRFGRELALEISVRGGGHNVAGKAVTDGGVMIDLSPMKRVDVDASARTITAAGGVTWGELNEAAYAHGLATTGGVISSTGIGGLTLGGGLGWLMGSYGLAVDNLISAEVVLASGEVVTASDDSEPDLFWAIRGGGGNFGVVTEFRYGAYPQGTVLGGAVVHSLGAAPEVFGFYREFTASISDELTTSAAFRHGPDGTKLCGVAVCHAAEDETRAAAEVQPLRQFGSPVVDLIERMPYPVVNTLIDDAFPRGTLNYWKSAFLNDLSDDAIGTLIAAFENSPTTMCFIIVEHVHGAPTRVETTATAFPHRKAGYNCIIISQWTDPAQNEVGVRWARETFNALRPHAADAVYVNYLDADDAGRVAAAYGPNYERLAELKRRYDPDNHFQLNQNIRP